MSLSLHLEAKATYLLATISGEFELQAAKAQVTEFLEAGAAAGLNRFLVDARQVRGRLTASERFEYAEHLANQVSAFATAGRLKRPRLAYVGNPPITDPLHFGLTVAVNRGIDATVTEDIEKAIRWLEGPPGK